MLGIGEEKLEEHTTTIESIEEKYNMDIDILLNEYETLKKEKEDLINKNEMLNRQLQRIYTLDDVSRILSNRIEYYDKIILNSSLTSSNYIDSLYIRREELTDVFDAISIDFVTRTQGDEEQ